MKKCLLVLFVSLIVGFSGSLSAQSRFWVAAGASNWNNAANWSATSGGAGGASVPSASNLAIFNANGVGNCNLDIAATVAGITVNGYTGSIDLVGFNLTTTGVNTFTSGTITNSGGAAALTLNTTGLTTFNGSVFTAAINGSTGRVLFNGSTFNNPVTITKTANTTDGGTGNNTFNAAVSLTNVSVNPLRLGITTRDIFNGTLSLNSGSTSTIDLAYSSVANQFNGNISITYTSTGPITFGANGGTSTLAVGQTVSIAGFGGGGCGNLSLLRFTQLGATPQIINLAGNNTATLTIGPASNFGGALSVTSPSFILNTSTFLALTLTKTGTQTDNQRGGNTFNGVFTANNQGGDLIFGSNPIDAGDIWNADAVFNNSGGNRIRIPEQTAGNIFNANATFNNTSATDVASRIQVGRLAGSQTTFNGTTTFFNNGNASDMQVSFDAGSSTTFNGPVIYTNSATTSPSDNFLGVDGTVSFASDLTITNNTTDIIYISNGSGTVTFGNGTINVGAFAAGSLRFQNFTQTGATAQSLTLTGTAALYLGPASTFNGNVNFIAPQLYLSGCAYNGTAYFEKTGATNNTGFGNNTFASTATIINNGSGVLRTNGNNIFNGPTTITNNSNSDILLEFASGSTYNGNVTFTNTGTSFIRAALAGTNIFNGNITVNSTNGIGIYFCEAAGSTATLNSPGTISVGGSGFSAGTLLLERFTQVGATAQNLTLTGTSFLRLGSTSQFDGNVIFISPRLYLDGCTYNGTAYLEKNGAGTDIGIGNNIFATTTTIVNSSPSVLRTNGNNTFNGTTTITNSGSQDILLELVTGSTYNGDVTFNNTGSSSIRVAFLGATAFNGNIVVNNPVGSGILFCESGTATATLANTRTITVGGSGFNSGNLNLPRFTQVGATAQTLTLTGTGVLTLGPSSTFNGNVTFGSPRILLNGTTYNGTATLQKTSVANDDGNGGNVFNSTAHIINSGDAYLRTAVVTADIFQGLLTLTNTGASTIRMADNAAGNQFNGNIELNSTFGGGIFFGNSAAGTSTLAAGRTIAVGTSGVISGDIRLIRFTQVGPTAQTLNLSGIAILTLGPTSSFGGNVDFRSPQLLLHGTTFDGVTYLEKEGAVDNQSNGGNTFNGTTTLVDSGSGYLLTANTVPDIFNGNLTVTNTGSNIIYLAHNVAGSQFNGNITVNSTLGSGGIYFANNLTGNATMGNGASLFVGGLGFSSGNLRFRRFTQAGPTPQTLLLTGTALLELGPTSTFNGNVDFRAPQFELDGCTFIGTTYLEKTGATANASNGGNVFNGVTTIANSGSGLFQFAVTALDTFNGDLTLTNTGSSAIKMADVVAGTVFNGNIQVNCTAGLGIFFGDNPPANATLANGRTISVGLMGFTIGELHLDRFIQLGATPQTLLLTGTSLLNMGAGNQFNGNVDFRAPQLNIGGTTFNGTAFLEKTGAGNSTGNGNNLFNSTTTIRNSGSGVLRTNGNNIFNGTTSITNAGTADLLLELTTGSIYNGDVTFTNTNVSNIRVAFIGATAFNGNILVNSTAGLGVYFAEDPAGSATLANGRTIAVGGTGFTAGDLRLTRFTQTGGTAQLLLLTGGSTLRVGPTVTWNGDLTISSPGLYLNGTTTNGTTNSITKTGATTDPSVGGNTFNGNTTFTNSGAGIFRFAGTTGDTFNGNNIFVRSNGTIQPAYNGTSTVNGNLSTNSATSIVYGANVGVVAFSGGAAQTISRVAGASPTFGRLTMSKSGNDLTLNTDISISVNATFTTGVINTTGANYLNFADNAIVVGGVNASYVDGPVRKTGNDPFTFPLGDDGFYRPASISAPTGLTHFFTAQYVNADHGLGSAGDPIFTSISKCEYWTIDRNPGIPPAASNVLVTLSWQEAACVPGYITNPAGLRVARWNGASWVNHGNGGTTGTATNGTIVTSGAVTSFSPFTLASAVLANPLPVELTSFTASITKSGTGLLKWHTESELNNDRFEIERSVNGVDFEYLGSVEGSGTTNRPNDYQFEDKTPVLSLAYYRLKQIDFDGEFEYSSLVPLDFTHGESNSGQLAISPNPINSGSFASFRSGNRTIIQSVTVYNSVNQVVRQYSEVGGFSTEGLAPGMYIVKNKGGEIFRLVIK